MKFPVINLTLGETSLAILALGAGVIVAEVVSSISPAGERVALAFGGALAGFISRSVIDAVKANANKSTPDKQDPAP